MLRHVFAAMFLLPLRTADGTSVSLFRLTRIIYQWFREEVVT